MSATRPFQYSLTIAKLLFKQVACDVMRYNEIAYNLVHLRKVVQIKVFHYYGALKQDKRLLLYGLSHPNFATIFAAYTADMHSSALGKSPSFIYQMKRYKYLYRNYSSTWATEREVEIPIAYKFINEKRGGRVLEVGNVLSHYFKIKHFVLDKYERAPMVINADIANFRPKTKFDRIVSISTLEHVGWDEKIKDPNKFERAVHNIRHMLKPNGSCLITMPLGYNPWIDRRVSENNLGLDKLEFMKRVTYSNVWKQCGAEEAKKKYYGYPFFAANAILIGYIFN